MSPHQDEAKWLLKMRRLARRAILRTAAGKAELQEASKDLKRLVKAGAKDGQEFILRDGTKVKLVDNFQTDEQQLFRTARFPRYVLKEVKPERAKPAKKGRAGK